MYRLSPEGNLFLINEENQDEFTSSYEMQKNLGCDIEWWDPGEIVKHYPLYNPKGYLAGTFGPKDGHFDAYGLLMGTRAKARSLGAVYIHDEAGRGPGRPGRGQRRETGFRRRNTCAHGHQLRRGLVFHARGHG